MVWWMWIVFGLALLVFEVLTPGGFFAVFFGIAALFVAFLVRFDIVTGVWAQWLLFAIVGAGFLAVFRPVIRKAFESRLPKVDSLVGEIAVASEDFGPDSRGKAELRGSSWNAHFQGSAPAKKGDRLKVTKVDGLWLSVEHE